MGQIFTLANSNRAVGFALSSIVMLLLGTLALSLPLATAFLLGVGTFAIPFVNEWSPSAGLLYLILVVLPILSVALTRGVVSGIFGSNGLENIAFENGSRLYNALSGLCSSLFTWQGHFGIQAH